jgi:hypothetical protein
MIGFHEIGCHIVFDIKMDFTTKARFCAGGQTTDTPTAMTYSSVVSRDSVRIGFMFAALNGLDVMACDLENVYLNALCVEKIWFEGELECVSDMGKVCVVVNALYSLKSAGESWHATLVQALRDNGFVSTIADPDVWIQPAAREDGYEYYEILLVYVDDVLAISHEPKILIDAIGEYYKVKPGSDKEPNTYLGANVEKVQMLDGRASPHDYVKNAIKTAKVYLLAEDREGYVLKNKAKNLFPMNYQPKLDVLNELGWKQLSSRYYLQLIGIVQWAIELGHIDIHHEVSLLSQYQANPRVGHLEALYHVFAYMKSHLDIGCVAFDPKTPVVDESAFNNGADWKEFYGEVQEELPPKMPKLQGQRVTISAFVDANHAGNEVTRHLHTGIIIYVQNATILWYSKRQNMVEAATFRSEMVALQICKELIFAICYKLRMFGVEIDGPANVFCNNRGIVNDNFRMNTRMVDTAPLIIWLVLAALMKNFCCCQRIQQRQSYKLRVHGVNPQSPLKV